MHATRARLPQKRTRSKKAVAKKAAPKIEAQAMPSGVTSLAAHRARSPHPAPAGVEIYALVEWIAPARESWRRGELEVRRSACMTMTALRQDDGTLTLTDLPGQGDALQLEPSRLEALASGAVSVLHLALPGLRVTLTEADLQPALPAQRCSAQILAFPTRARA